MERHFKFVVDRAETRLSIQKVHEASSNGKNVYVNGDF